MTVPRENFAAFYPQPVKVGGVMLRPVTLGDAVRMAQCGVEISRSVPDDALAIVASIMAGMTVAQFSRRYKGGLSELSEAVEKVLNDGFATFIRARADERKGAVKHLTPHGIGWPLECAEFLCAEYGWSWGDAIDTPCATVFALIAACRERNGGKHGGLDYMERQYRDDLKAGRTQSIRFDSGRAGDNGKQ